MVSEPPPILAGFSTVTLKSIPGSFSVMYFLNAEESFTFMNITYSSIYFLSVTLLTDTIEADSLFVTE